MAARDKASPTRSADSSVAERPAPLSSTVSAAGPRVLHLVIGPAQHGVVAHAIEVARACGDTLLRFDDPEAIRVPAGYDVVHIPFTDRLFGSSAEASACAFEAVASQVLATGATLSVTLHDVPSGCTPLAMRRRKAYTRVVARVGGLVVASNAELADAELLNDQARSRCVIPLPVAERVTRSCFPTGSTVAVLGFVYPDRGYEQVIAALPAGLDVLAIGRAATGHEQLPEKLCQMAQRAGRSWQLTGYLPDHELRHWLESVAVPVAPNRRTAASASIATWLAHGRRPLVPLSPYTRELAQRWPNTLCLYDADSPHGLRDAIQHAHENPDSTILEPGVQAGADTAVVARAYRAHFAACAPPRIVPVGGGRLTVTDNRWDLLAGLTPEQVPCVSVVIPYYNAPQQLRLVLYALTLQSHPASRLEVIVADDGSSFPPCLDTAGDLTIHVVRQEDLGFRAAAARNLGAAAASGDVLLFLDADTVPEPDYVARMARLPSLSVDALVVGRRRHADFHGWGPGDLADWLLHGGTPPPELTEPRWLRDGYRTSRNLLDIDARSYRYVISAVLAMNRELFREIGGFCEQFTSYGGEDWELAHRAYCAGALLAHEPAAVAWHDGPDWADRNVDHERSKAEETRMLRRLLPDAEARGPGQWLPYPAVVIRMVAAEPCEVAESARSAFESGADCGIWLSGPDASRTIDQTRDPRILIGPPPADVLQRCLFLVDLPAPTNLTDLPQLLEIAAGAGEVVTPEGRFRAHRAVARATRHASAFGDDPDAALQALFGQRATSSHLRGTMDDAGHTVRP